MFLALMNCAGFSPIACVPEVLPDGLRPLNAQRRGAPPVIDDRNGSELVLLHNAEADARVGLDLLLEVLGKLFVAFGGDDRQRVHVEAPQSLPLLIYTNLGKTGDWNFRPGAGPADFL
jgi:hypothetical protein